MNTEKKETATINYTMPISDELIENLLCVAFEGGITYWAAYVSCEDNEDMKKVGGHKSEYLTKTKKKDAKLIIHETHGGQVAISKKSIIDALQEMDDKGNGCTKALARILNEKYDADDCDIVVQIACFGRVVYA